VTKFTIISADLMIPQT